MNKGTLALALAASCMGLHLGAAASDTPPPGLYRIDSDATSDIGDKSGEMRTITKGDSGDTEIQWRQGERSKVRQFKGDKPVTHCVKSSKGPPLPPEATSCTTESTSKTAAGVTHTSICPMGKLSVTIRQLGKDRWEYLADMAMVAGAAGGHDGMSHVLAHRAKYGATAQERAQAQQQLKEWAQTQKEEDAARAQTILEMQAELKNTTDPVEKAELAKSLADMGPGAPVQKTRVRNVWTRIASTCN